MHRHRPPPASALTDTGRRLSLLSQTQAAAWFCFHRLGLRGGRRLLPLSASRASLKVCLRAGSQALEVAAGG